jgi:4-diphosphocytidyl-2-C-methyl-D-erythritol kinase
VKALHDLPAPAKLNLFLHLVGRRADGYHLLQSVFVPIDWCDALHLERRDDGRLQRHDLGAALPEDDLCLRAARALQAASGTPYGADIHLDKTVPWGAGLGGGSSDAATTLIGLNRLWGLHWSRQRLIDLGVTLGADVPFFLGPGPAWVEGIGERLTPLDFEPGDFVVLKPAQSLPTRDIFASEHLVRDTKPAIVADFLARPQGFGRNDMQAAAVALSGQVAQALAMLEDRYGHGGHSRMTGSGSAVFAWLGKEDGVGSNAGPRDNDLIVPEGWQWRRCRGLRRHPLAEWLSG